MKYKHAYVRVIQKLIRTKTVNLRRNVAKLSVRISVTKILTLSHGFVAEDR